MNLTLSAENRIVSKGFFEPLAGKRLMYGLITKATTSTHFPFVSQANEKSGTQKALYYVYLLAG
jgi:hypothetical protein